MTLGNEVFSFDTHYLFFTALVTICMQLSFFFVAAFFKFDKVTDFAGGTNFILIAVLTFAISKTYYWRQIVATVFVILWGVRLSGYLLYRIIVIGKDDRFDGTREDFWKFLVFWIFQMLWVWAVSLPVTFLNGTQADCAAGGRDIAGILMFAVGLTAESISDHQKFNFKNIPSNRRRFCDEGLWCWSRHPNYFGEMLLWWGLFTLCSSVFGVAALEAEGSWGYATIVGPVFLCLILLFVSGIPPLERSYDEKFGTTLEYQAYKASTSPLVPMPPGVYRKLPEILKKTIFFEWYTAEISSQ